MHTCMGNLQKEAQVKNKVPLGRAGDYMAEKGYYFFECYPTIAIKLFHVNVSLLIILMI